MQTIKITLTSEHFLYLPLFYAEKKEWFGYIDDNKDFRVETESFGEEVQVSDVDVIRKVKQKPEADIQFGICDPAYLLTEPKSITDDIIVLAAIVTNAGLWAVGNSKAKVDDSSIEALGDNFNKFFAYKGENTSHKIANIIMKSSENYEEKTSEQIPLRFRSESKFIRYQLTKDADATDWVVITPNILSVHKTTDEEPHAHAILSIGATQQFANVLSSALITTKTFRDANQGLCDAICRALQRAMILTVCEDREVVDFAQKKFGVERYIAKNALAEAVKDRVFPPLISVSRGEWNAACRAHHAMRHLHEDLPDDNSTDSESYKNYVEDCVGQVHKTVSEELTSWFGDLRNDLRQDHNLCERIVGFFEKYWPRILEWCKTQWEKTINKLIAAFVTWAIAWWTGVTEFLSSWLSSN